MQLVAVSRLWPYRCRIAAAGRHTPRSWGLPATDRLSAHSLRLRVSDGHTRPSILWTPFAVNAQDINYCKPNAVSSAVVFEAARVWGPIRAGPHPLCNQHRSFRCIDHVCTRHYASSSFSIVQKYLPRSNGQPHASDTGHQFAPPASTPQMSKVAKSTPPDVWVETVTGLPTLHRIVRSLLTQGDHELVQGRV